MGWGRMLVAIILGFGATLGFRACLTVALAGG